MKRSRRYNITPALGQALLDFQGRRFPENMDVFETEATEEVRTARSKGQQSLDEDLDPNPGFRNLLIQGDCLSACAHLKSENISVDLVYIDPPFASGANYAKKIYLRNGGKSTIETNGGTIGEEVMYGDIWQKEDYLNWLYERLLVIKEVMSETGSIYVHLDWHIGHYAKVLMDEVFGEENFVNEIIWNYSTQGRPVDRFAQKHDTIFMYAKDNEVRYFNLEEAKTKYSKSYIDSHFTDVDKEGKKCRIRIDAGVERIYYPEEGMLPNDVWDIPYENSMSLERTDYVTQKPHKLLERIIKASSDEGMIVADFFSGSGTTAKVARDLNRKFIACDIGVNAIQTTRDRLAKAGADFDVLKIKDGLRLFRNPEQTTAKIFNLISGFRTSAELELGDFWDGGIASAKGSYTPIKFSGIHRRLTKELIDFYLEEIYKLEDTTDQANAIMIIYAHKAPEIDQKYLNRLLDEISKTELKVKLVALDDLLGERKDTFFTPDGVDIRVRKQKNKCKVEIKKYYSPYLKNKIDEYNAQKTQRGAIEQDLSKAVEISKEGLELIEAVQFDTTLKKVWKSNPALEDKAGAKEKIKGAYLLDTDKFKLKIRNIAGDEIILASDEL